MPNACQVYYLVDWNINSCRFQGQLQPEATGSSFTGFRLRECWRGYDTCTIGLNEGLANASLTRGVATEKKTWQIGRRPRLSTTRSVHERRFEPNSLTLSSSSGKTRGGRSERVILRSRVLV